MTDRCLSREKGQPLCMEQHYRLFSTYREPGLDKDELIDTTANQALRSEHVIVVCQNQMYVLDLVVNFIRLDEEQIYEQLQRIKRHSEREEKTLLYSAHVGYLTTLSRNEWFQVKDDLVKESKVNVESLKQIERSICVICLDKKIDLESVCSTRQSDEDEENIKTNNHVAQHLNEEINLARVSFQMLHGHKTNSGNRWFDKTMQFIVSEDGCCGLNYESSVAEGLVISEICQHMLRYM